MKFFTTVLARRVAEQTKARFESVANADPEPLARLAAALAITYGGTARGFDRLTTN